MVFFTSKYSLIISTAGINVEPSPKPIMSENVKNKYSMQGAIELRQKPSVAIKAPEVITSRFPYFLQRILPTSPVKKYSFYEEFKSD